MFADSLSGAGCDLYLHAGVILLSSVCSVLNNYVS